MLADSLRVQRQPKRQPRRGASSGRGCRGFLAHNGFSFKDGPNPKCTNTYPCNLAPKLETLSPKPQAISSTNPESQKLYLEDKETQ